MCLPPWQMPFKKQKLQRKSVILLTCVSICVLLLCKHRLCELRKWKVVPHTQQACLGALGDKCWNVKIIGSQGCSQSQGENTGWWLFPGNISMPTHHGSVSDWLIFSFLWWRVAICHLCIKAEHALLRIWVFSLYHPWFKEWGLFERGMGQSDWLISSGHLVISAEYPTIFSFIYPKGSCPANFWSLKDLIT